MRKKPSPQSANQNTSWEPVEKWYNKTVGDDGHYYHQNIVIPGVLRLLNLEKSNATPNVLDIACGQGILARKIPQNISYTGLDLSSSLIKAAKASDKNPLHQYVVADATKPFPIKNQAFTHATVILALQNIEHPESLFKNLNPFLIDNGTLVIVLNHPCFRIPRQSSWQVDQEKKIQYRRVDRYASSMQIPIQAHPSKGVESATTHSFHFSLSAYSKMLENAGFVMTSIEEWC